MSAMSRTSWAAVAIAVLAACIGASLGRKSQPAVTPQAQSRAQQTIDQAKVLPLAPVRAPADFGERAFAHVRQIVEFGQRHPGNPPAPGWQKQLDYIGAELQRHGLEPRRDTWRDAKEGITFANVSATIPGARKERIVLGCHHDTKRTHGHADETHNFDFVGANDGASAVGFLLALAPVLKARANEATIELVFFDGEESLDWNWNDAARALFGSRRYVQRHRDAAITGKEPRIAALVLLDMVGRTDLHIQEETYSTPELRRIAWSAAVACGHERYFFVRAEPAADDHKPFLDVGIPAIDLIDLNGNPHWHTPTDTLENMSASSLQLVGDVVLTMLPAVERAYVVAGG